MKDKIAPAILVLFILGVFAFVGSLPLAKFEICRTYYPEVSAWSCFVSDYGLPARGGK